MSWARVPGGSENTEAKFPALINPASRHNSKKLTDVVNTLFFTLRPDKLQEYVHIRLIHNRHFPALDIERGSVASHWLRPTIPILKDILEGFEQGDVTITYGPIT
jgi:hypothetical protein